MAAGSARAEFTRVYAQYGRMAHLVRSDSQAQFGEALCRRNPRTAWLGTGSQEEYELAGRMRLCPRCGRVRDARL